MLNELKSSLPSFQISPEESLKLIFCQDSGLLLNRHYANCLCRQNQIEI